MRSGRDRILQRKDPQPQERRDQAGGGRGLEDLHQAAGMVTVWMGQVDPAQVGRVRSRFQSASRKSAREAGKPRVDEHRLLGVQDVGVDRQEAEAGNGCGVGQRDDVGGGACHLHVATPPIVVIA